MKLKIKLMNALAFCASLEATLISLGLMMLLVLFGTLAQVHIGTFAAQQEFFNSFVVWGMPFGVRMPIFPGGLIVGGLWAVNLTAAFIMRFDINKKNTGILLSHFGLILLVGGQFLAQALSRESQMPVEVGHSSSFSESSRQFELAFTMVSDAETDEIVSIPQSRFDHPGLIESPLLPFKVNVLEYYPNADIRMGASTPTRATEGIGTRVSIQSAPLVSSDEEINNASAFIEILDGDRRLGVWLVAAGLGAPQSFFLNGKEYQPVLRLRRHYFPFTITLKEFHHDRYPGTDIPKNFSSLIHLSDPGRNEERDALIYMNHPLRYAGKTFYQASFGKNDTLSIFQVVENPAWTAPYVACALVLLGLAIQFLSHLLAFMRKPK